MGRAVGVTGMKMHGTLLACVCAPRNLAVAGLVPAWMEDA